MTYINYPPPRSSSRKISDTTSDTFSQRSSSSKAVSISSSSDITIEVFDTEENLRPAPLQIRKSVRFSSFDFKFNLISRPESPILARPLPIPPIRVDEQQRPLPPIPMQQQRRPLPPIPPRRDSQPLPITPTPTLRRRGMRRSALVDFSSFVLPPVETEDYLSPSEALPANEYLQIQEPCTPSSFYTPTPKGRLSVPGRSTLEIPLTPSSVYSSPCREDLSFDDHDHDHEPEQPLSSSSIYSSPPQNHHRPMPHSLPSLHLLQKTTKLSFPRDSTTLFLHRQAITHYNAELTTLAPLLAAHQFHIEAQIAAVTKAQAASRTPTPKVKRLASFWAAGLQNRMSSPGGVEGETEEEKGKRQLRERIVRLRARAWRRERFDAGRYQELCKRALEEL